MHAESSTIIHGKYEVLDQLGAGGMGSVYRARHVLTEQLVALKILRVGPGDANLARRFKLEVSVAAKVAHPAIVKVFDAGVEPEAGRFYLAMELLEGRSLRDAMADEDADARALVEHLVEGLEAMEAAHQRGVIHRDLKPDNLFLEETPDGPRVRVLDFGIARDLAGPSVTTTGVAVGTALYMSPEQGTAAKDIGPAVDVWAMGVMLYEVLAGRLPFDGASAHAVVIEAVTMPHLALAELRPDLPPEWSALLDRCLSKKPAGRPSAGELASALRTLLAEPTRLTPPPREALVATDAAGLGTAPFELSASGDADTQAAVGALVSEPARASEPAPAPPTDRRPLAMVGLAVAGIAVVLGVAWVAVDASSEPSDEASDESARRGGEADEREPPSAPPTEATTTEATATDATSAEAPTEPTATEPRSPSLAPRPPSLAEGSARRRRGDRDRPPEPAPSGTSEPPAASDREPEAPPAAPIAAAPEASPPEPEPPPRPVEPPSTPVPGGRLFDGNEAFDRDLASQRRR